MANIVNKAAHVVICLPYKIFSTNRYKPCNIDMIAKAIHHIIKSNR